MIRKSLYKLFRWVNNYGSIPVLNEESDYITSNHGFNKKMSSSGEGIGKPGMNFTIHPAAGGYILEYRVYDQRTERNDNKLHIINEDQNLGESIGKIITLEILRT
jgi:hypothetical protein